MAVPALRFGNVVVGLQPARGYHIDPAASYHDPDLVPPHGYLAFYAWLRARVHAVVHMGKHGNLEWLPGKALALSAACFPEAALGPLPHVYPFIVNDPGEGTQAKRRAQAVIVDHLTPPLTRAESYGPLADLERLVDEYYEASGVDPRRLAVLREEILDLVARLGLDRDCGIAPGEEAGEALSKLDAYLCELKEMQIRDGLHVFGRSPGADQLLDLLVALVRLPRGADEGAGASLTRALARDLGLDGFDPPRLRPRGRVDGAPSRGARERPEWLGRPGRPERPTVAVADGRRYRRAPGSARPRSRRREPCVPGVVGRNPGGAGGGERAHPARGRGVRGGRDPGRAHRPRGPVPRARPFRRSDPRPARGAPDRAQLLLGRHPHRADPGRLAARLEVGGAARRAPPAGARGVAAADGPLRVGHVEHAHRGRRRRPGPGPDGGAPGVGAELRAGHRVRGAAARPPRPPPGST